MEFVQTSLLFRRLPGSLFVSYFLQVLLYVCDVCVLSPAFLGLFADLLPFRFLLDRHLGNSAVLISRAYLIAQYEESYPGHTRLRLWLHGAWVFALYVDKTQFEAQRTIYLCKISSMKNVQFPVRHLSLRCADCANKMSQKSRLLILHARGFFFACSCICHWILRLFQRSTSWLLTTRGVLGEQEKKISGG